MRAFGALVLAGCVSSVAVAADAAELLNVHAEIAPDRNARAVLTFATNVPQYRVYGDGTNDVSILLVDTTRPSNMSASISGHDSLKSISIQPIGNDVEVTFHEGAAAKLSIGLGRGQSLLATITTNAAPPLAAFGTPVAPFTTSTPAPALAGGTEMDVYPLKYADVSEVVGLLVPGQQIASNDTFTPQEQNFGTSGIGGGFGGLGGLSSPLSGTAGASIS
ncbi:MAG TPA: hypothetical protein VGD50_00960, partial [Candidatus Baltobacteraceae bacterium]